MRFPGVARSVSLCFLNFSTSYHCGGEDESVAWRADGARRGRWLGVQKWKRATAVGTEETLSLRFPTF
jgi:hypothetical protein